jgi:hypothetical protein
MAYDGGLGMRLSSVAMVTKNWFRDSSHRVIPQLRFPRAIEAVTNWG